MEGVDLIAAARGGDEQAYAGLVAPYRAELQAHCYRILGSVQDAEDQVQETLLAAWRHLAGFEGRASIRTWLFRIATRRCLDALRAASRRPPVTTRPAHGGHLTPTRLGEVVWLDPYPDALLEGLPDDSPGPEARYAAREAISLAFVTALQLLPPRQRAVLVLRDVLGFTAPEAAGILGSSQESVTSALKRARSALRAVYPGAGHEPPPAPRSAAEQAIVERLTEAYETGKIAELVALLTDDVLLGTPLAAPEYQGRTLVASFLRTVIFPPGRGYRLVPTRANGQPAFGVYVRDPHAGIAHAHGLLVLTLSGTQVSRLTRFDNSVLPSFGLPRTVPS
jgi:RNA polymerase sigma-70 factor (ECF subfamily)